MRPQLHRNLGTIFQKAVIDTVEPSLAEHSLETIAYYLELLVREPVVLDYPHRINISAAIAPRRYWLLFCGFTMVMFLIDPCC